MGNYFYLFKIKRYFFAANGVALRALRSVCICLYEKRIRKRIKKNTKKKTRKTIDCVSVRVYVPCTSSIYTCMRALRM